MIKKILVPTDFSAPAKEAFRTAVHLAQKGGGQIYLLNVVEPIRSYVAATDGMYIDANVEEKYIKYLRENAQGLLDNMLQDNKPGDIPVETHVELGSVFAIINEMVKKEEIDLIVMGTQGVSGLDEILIGSNTEKMVRTAHCPVLAIREGVDLSQVKNVIMPTNLKEDQVKALPFVKGLQALLGFHLHLVYINIPNDFYTSREIAQRKAAYLEKAQLENYTFHVYNEINEENGILYFAQDHEVDMIILPTHQRTGLAHLISGSIAEDVVNHAKRPVLTIGLKHLKS